MRIESHPEFYQLKLVSQSDFEKIMQQKPLCALNLFGQAAVFAMEITAGKIVRTQLQIYNVKSPNEEIKSFIRQLNPENVLLYLVGGGHRIREKGLFQRICEIVGAHISFQRQAVKFQINDLRALRLPLRDKRDFDFISACLCTDGTLRWTLHDLGIQD